MILAEIVVCAPCPPSASRHPPSPSKVNWSCSSCDSCCGSSCEQTCTSGATPARTNPPATPARTKPPTTPAMTKPTTCCAFSISSPFCLGAPCQDSHFRWQTARYGDRFATVNDALALLLMAESWGRYAAFGESHRHGTQPNGPVRRAGGEDGDAAGLERCSVFPRPSAASPGRTCQLLRLDRSQKAIGGVYLTRCSRSRARGPCRCSSSSSGGVGPSSAPPESRRRRRTGPRMLTLA